MLDMIHIYMQIDLLLAWVEHIVDMKIGNNAIIFLGNDLDLITI